MQAPGPPILILTTQTGGGHLNLAQSLRDMLEARYPVVIANPQSRSVDVWYSWVSRHWMPFLMWQYAFTDNAFTSYWLHQWYVLTSKGQLLRIIDRVRPRLVIATHAVLSVAAARAIESSGRHIPLVFQLTDLEQLNSMWFTEKHADAYLAPTREIFAQALARGISPERLHLTGRPVRRQFVTASSSTREETLASLDFDPALLTLFLQGGAKGSAGVDRTFENLPGVPVQVILATGNNKAMAARYAAHEHVRVLPFTEEIAHYMAASDVIVGKAGASFITEAFTLGKPMLITSFIPGQETPNLRFVERYNLGWVCLDAAQKLLASIAANRDILAEKGESIRAYAAWNRERSQRIVPVIEQLLDEPGEHIHNS